MKRVILPIALLVTLATAGEQFAMSDADRAMYKEMLRITLQIFMLKRVERYLRKS